MVNSSATTSYCNETSNEQIRQLRQSVAFLQWFETNIFPPLIYTLATAGIVGSCLTLLTMQSKTYGNLQPFTKLTRINTVVCIVLDVVNFMTAFVVNSLFDETATCGLLLFYRLLRGIINYLVLVSDFLFLILTVERYIAICHTIRWYTTAIETKERMLTVAIVVTFVISIVRFHNGIEYYCSFRRKHQPANVLAFTALRTLVNLSFPTLLFFPLVYMNVHIFRSIRRQAQLQALKCPTSMNQSITATNDNDAKRETLITTSRCVDDWRARTRNERKTTLGITAINLALFMFNALIYYSCSLQSFYQMVYAQSAKECNEIVFKLYTEELLLAHFMSIQLLRTFAASAMFYVYLVFNRTFRDEFVSTMLSFYHSAVSRRSQSSVRPIAFVCHES